MLNALAFAGLTLAAGLNGVALPPATFLVRGAVCSSLRGPRLFVVDQDGTSRRLRFSGRAQCLAARRRLKPVLDQARRHGGRVFVTPAFDGRQRIVDIGLPTLER